LPVRHRLKPADTIADLLLRTRQNVLDGFAHQAAPFEEVARVAGVERAQGRNPLFQVMVTHHADPQTDDVVLDGLVVENVPATLAAAKTDLELDLVETGTGLDGQLTYDTDILDPATIDRFIAAFEQVLTAIATTPTLPIAELLPTDSIPAVHGEPLDVPDTTLDGLIRQQAAATPDGVAVVGDDGTALTYARFNARVNAAARILLDRGVGIGDRVAVILPRSVDLVVTLAAIVRVGAAFVPIDTSYPAGRIQTILADSTPVLVATDSASAAGLADVTVGRLLLDDPEVATALTAGSAESPELSRPLSSRDVAYVIFTSGTTGRPKGVAVSHQAIVNLIAWRQDTFPITATERVLQKTSVGFDVAVPEFFWPLTVGAAVRLIRPAGERDPEYLATILRDEPIGFVELVPTVLQAMLDTEFDPATSPVRHLSLGGEALPAALGRRLQDVPGVNVWNTYGPTEAAVDATGISLADVDLTHVPVVPIGGPVANVRAVVLDAWLRPTAPGVVGELYLGGVQLADGYVGRPGLTAERFIADDSGQRLYRTGDLVTWNNQGQLEFLGRVDDQVKIRGFRIELDEIRNVLETHKDVSAAAVVALDHPAGGKFLAAYAITSAPIEALRAHAETRLPEYMVPTTFTQLDALPVTANGKLDRRALPTPELGGAAGREPQTPTERVLVEVFREVLRLPEDAALSVDDDFFRLGGHSLLATRAVARAGARLGANLTLRDVFDRPTVARLADLIDGSAPDTTPPLPLVGEVPRPDVLPVSYGQQSLWLIEQLGGPGGRYVVPLVLRLTGTPDEAALTAALRDVVARHEALRTLIVEEDGRLRQDVVSEDNAASRLPLEVEPFSDARVAEVVQGRFDLGADLPIRAALLRVNDAEWVLVLAMHHHAVDEWSFPLLLDDLSTAYRARTQGAPPAWD
ncbi:amino acid adenylation domain-containing protein, partial [Actinocorallia sp. API 0066]|uniref:non-ribosomal peptide synthetase n=1 Tax=Actinocorallia sp. API 0066 TaxID=2896846 RepID=UPI001E4673CE